jgi:hypothetical protein
MRFNRFWVLQLVLTFSVGASSTAWAVPYASFVHNTTGSTWEFVLNESADNVTVLRDGGNPLNLGALTAGRQTFDMTGFSSYEIQVKKSAPVAWTTISDPNQPFQHFEQGSDVAVNNNPANPLFGTIYVNNDRDLAAAGAAGRPMGDGVYALTANGIGVDLPTKAALTDPADTSAAKKPNWTVSSSGTTPNEPVSAWRMTLDAAGNLIVSDWSDSNGGIKWASGDLTTGGPLLKFEDGIRPLFINDLGQEVHGSIVSRPYVTGSVGNNLVVYGMDEDLDKDGETLNNATTGNHIWKWNVGSVANTDPSGGYDGAPQLVINVSNLGTTTDNRKKFLDLNVGVQANAVYSPLHNKWYLTENRSNANEGGLVVVTPDGVDGNSPTVDWSSLQFSIDNNLDGFTGFPATPAGNTTDLQDIFRSFGGGIELSADGTKLLLHRVATASTNPVLGSTSNTPGAVVIIPLDANGIPNLQVSGGVVTNLSSITTAGNNASATRRGLAIDAAGNVYTTNNNTELLEIFSPGGSYIAKTTSAGTFSLTPFTPGGVAGDYNNNGTVDAADYVVWRNASPTATLPNDPTPGTVDASDYATFKANFGKTAGSGAGLDGGAVPEPAGVVLALAGLLIASGFRRRTA